LANQVIIYTIPTCPWCRQAKEYLRQKGIQYTDHNVAEDRQAFDRMYKLTGQAGVPVIVIDDEFIIGFNTKEIDEALSSRRIRA
jgi:glutaredoxin 3